MSVVLIVDDPITQSCTSLPMNSGILSTSTLATSTLYSNLATYHSHLHLPEMATTTNLSAMRSQQWSIRPSLRCHARMSAKNSASSSQVHSGHICTVTPH